MKCSQILKMTFWITFLLLATGCATKSDLVQTPKPDNLAPTVKISTIQQISFVEEENYTRIKIEGSETIASPFYKLLYDPTRIAIDVPNIDLKQIKSPLKIENGTVSDVLTTQYDDKGRIEIGLLQMTNYNITKEEKNLIVDIEKVKKVAEAPLEVKKEELPIKETKVDPSPAPPVEPVKKEPPVLPPAEPVKEEPPPSPTIVNKAKEVTDIFFEERNGLITFNLIGDGRIENYNSFQLDSPARLVLDIWGVESRYPKKSIRMKNPFVKAVRIGQHPDKLRLVFDSSKPELPPYQINQKDEKIIVSLGDLPQPSEPKILIEGKPKGGTPAPTLAKAPSTPEGETKIPNTNTLTEINFKQMDHKSRIVVILTGEPNFESQALSENMIAVDIKNAFVPKHLQRGLDTSEFESGVNYITIQNVKAGKASDVRISIKLREALPFETASEGKALFIDIERPKKIEAKVETQTEPKKEVAAEVKKEEVKKEEITKDEEVKKAEKSSEELKTEKGASVGETPAPKPRLDTAKISEEGQKKVYSGRKLSLDFKDADIKNILRLIAEVSNLNIIAGDEVTGKITMRLVEVPWDQALDIILQSKNLGMTQVGNVVRIAPKDALKKEVQAELESRKAKEKLEDLVMELIPVNYSTAKEIMPQVKSILSERGDVKVDERTNILIVKDIPKSIPNVKNLVKSLDTKTPLVMIEARIIEASSNFQRELGTRWGFVASGGDSRNVKVGGGNVTTTQGTTTSDVVNLPAVARSGLGAAGGGTAGVLEFLFTSVYGLEKLDVAISAHENKGELKIISSPKIATLDNKEASVEQGLRIPYLKLAADFTTATTDFIEANIKLTVIPHVTNDGNIKMNIRVKKDAPDTSLTVGGVPSIDKKEAISEVLIKDGGVVAIAGIYTIEKSDQNEGVPLFSKIPLLGWLFKRENKEDKRKDLLIFISPKIIKDQV